ncbi:MAG: VCBS repeat-containing protein [Phycisphaerae bacterium]|jgi:hypothetical protein
MSAPVRRCAFVLIGAALSAPCGAQMFFNDAGPAAGVNSIGYGRGAAMVDLDGDGLLDIVATYAGMPASFFRQRSDHTFELANSAWGIPGDAAQKWGVVVADFDNDGDPDVFFPTGGFLAYEPDILLRNDLNMLGVFTDVSVDAGDVWLLSKNFGATALDYNRDGLLDIFVTVSDASRQCLLLRNDGGLHFTDVSASAGISAAGQYRHCSSGDFNNDGWWDIAAGNEVSSNLLYRNNGNGTFTDVAVPAGVGSPLANFGLVLEDFDNDGWMDIYVPKYQVTPLVSSQVCRNNGNGTFSDLSLAAGMTGQADMGHNTGDLDSDGFPDIFIGTGSPPQPYLDVLFRMTVDAAGRWHATDVSKESGILKNGPTRCHGIAMGDYDQDGDVDVFACNGGPSNGENTIETAFLWQNAGNAHHWVGLRLHAVVSNRSAVGARAVAVTASGRKVFRALRAGNGFANTDSPVLHFGLGAETQVARIEIFWPSGMVQAIAEPAIDQVTEVYEAGIAGDLDGDGAVALADLSRLLSAYGACVGNPTYDPPADVDLDACIGLGDLSALLSNFGAGG